MSQIRRAALLIGAPALKDHPYLSGVDSDMAILKTFLASANGGAWTSNEIHSLKNPRKSEILTLLSKFEGSTDYFFCAFGGHGHHFVTQDQTSLCINDDEEIRVSEIFPSIDRQTLVIDACRQLTHEVLELSMKTAMLFEARTVPSPYVESCRAKFDAAVMGAEKGRIVTYSCSCGESADDGLFTPALVAVSEQWGMANFPTYGQTASKALSISEAFLQAKRVTIEKNKLQNPEFVPGRRLGYFPLAVA